MLRINASQSSAQAKNYFSAELSKGDYYEQGQEIAGDWGGKAATFLGLSGEISQDDFNALVDNKNPTTGEKLTSHNKDNRICGYDFTWNAPKSLSLIYEYSHDDRFLNAFHEAVKETMDEVEKGIQTRIRKKGVNEDRLTGNLVFGMFTHFTSRPIDNVSVPDPNLHCHCYVPNCTYDFEEQKWKAAKFLRLKQDAPYYEAAFHSRLAEKVKALGVDVERDGKFWKVKGIEKETLDRFSKRTKQINELAEKLGLESAEAKAKLGATTRHKKRYGLSHDDLREIWEARLTEEEKHTLDTILSSSSDNAELPRKTAEQCVEYALSHELERQTVCPLSRLKETALRFGVGEVSVEEIQGEFKTHEGLIVQEMDGREMATTQTLFQMEKQMIDFAFWNHNSRAPLNANFEVGEITDYSSNSRFDLGKQQKKAVEHVLQSGDRVVAIEGKAGTGKTTALAALIDGIQSAGKEAICLAPTGDAAYKVMRDDGDAYQCKPMQNANTLARFLIDDKLQQQSAEGVWIVDEAGLMGTGDMHRLFSLAEEHNARVVLVGDTAQHRSVNQGDAFRILQKEAQLDVVSIDEIRRQKKSAYREAVKFLSSGKLVEGFEKLDLMGAIKEDVDREERYSELAEDYTQALGNGKKVLIVSPTHREGELVTKKIRASLKEAGKIGEQEEQVTRLKNCHLTEAQRTDSINYEIGNVVRFHQNAKGIKRGEQFTISQIDDQSQVWMKGEDGKEIPLNIDQAKRFNLYEQDEIPLASGDRIRITEGGKSLEGKRLNNGAVYEVDHIDKHGNVVLNNGWTLDQRRGNFDYGFVNTSHSSQGKTVDHIFIAQSSASLGATSAEQFYVSASRGKHEISVYTDNKEALRENITNNHQRTSAHELLKAKRANQIAIQQLHHSPSMVGAIKYYATHIAKEMTGWLEWFRDKPQELENWQKRVRENEMEHRL